MRSVGGGDDDDGAGGDEDFGAGGDDMATKLFFFLPYYYPSWSLWVQLASRGPVFFFFFG